ncbi:glutamyl-tRNA reductase, partial [Bacillus altitudinis]|nr:glutamyl-tRNA reductase [Bacillus altitudinis]
ALREKALSIQADTMQSIERKLPNLTNREMKLLNKHTKSIINQMLKDPILKAKEIAGEPNAEEKLLLFKEIFDLQVEDEEQKAEPMQVEQGAFQLFKTNMAQGLATVASE